VTVLLILSDVIEKKICDLAEKDGISINQFIIPALAEKIAALEVAE
jgi:predicted HicB family RNase H-like nuclease